MRSAGTIAASDAVELVDVQRLAARDVAQTVDDAAAQEARRALERDRLLRRTPARRRARAPRAAPRRPVRPRSRRAAGRAYTSARARCRSSRRRPSSPSSNRAPCRARAPRARARRVPHRSPAADTRGRSRCGARCGGRSCRARRRRARTRTRARPTPCTDRCPAARATRRRSLGKRAAVPLDDGARQRVQAHRARVVAETAPQPHGVAAPRAAASAAKSGKPRRTLRRAGSRGRLAFAAA